MRGSRIPLALGAIAAIAVTALVMNVAQIVRAGGGAAGVAPSVPSVMSYQGVLSDPGTGAAVADGNYNMSFIIYDAAAAGTALWEEPTVGSVPVAVSGGLFTHLLGSTEPLTSTVFASGDTYLQVFVNGETLSPRQPITTVAYALIAEQAATASSIDGVSLDGLDSRFVNSRGGDFPRPNYDSDFQPIAADETLEFTHDLGGNTDDYVVDLTCDRPIDGIFYWGMDHGADEFPEKGVGWFGLNDSTIKVRRGDADAWCDTTRVRIWKMPTEFFIPFPPIIILP